MTIVEEILHILIDVVSGSKASLTAAEAADLHARLTPPPPEPAAPAADELEQFRAWQASQAAGGVNLDAPADA